MMIAQEVATVPERFGVPEGTPFGFVPDGLGTHASRTIMLRELRLLLEASPAEATLERYQSAVLEENVLLKRTQTTRAKSLRHLRELYGLDRRLLLFRALRDLWEADPESQPLLAIECALARDPSLRATAQAILDAQPGQPLTPQALAAAFAAEHPGRLNPTTLATVGRNAASSWTQSGHLLGRSAKVRASVRSRPPAVAYALLLGFLAGARGDALFDTAWCRLLDAPAHLLHDQAFVASQQGWLEYRHAGMVTEISFRYLLREEE